MMKFRTPYTEMKTVFANPGQRFEVVYDLKIDEKGKRKIVKTGTTDVQAAIDAEFASVDFNMVLRRLENGDEEALNRAEAFYADVADLPVDIRDIMEMNEQASKIFADMPVEYRSVYGNDYMQFLFDPGKLIDVINAKNSEAQEKVSADHDNEE